MKAGCWISLGTTCLYVCMAPIACAQQTTAPAQYGALAKLQSPKRIFDAGQELVANLEAAGLVDRRLPAPYRIAVPLMDFGDSASKLKLTYSRNVGGNTDAGGVVLFFTMEIP